MLQSSALAAALRACRRAHLVALPLAAQIPPFLCIYVSIAPLASADGAIAVQRRLKLTGSKIRVRLGPKWFEFDMRKKADKCVPAHSYRSPP